MARAWVTLGRADVCRRCRIADFVLGRTSRCDPRGARRRINKGKLLMLSSECSFIGYQFQQEFHIPSLPAQTVHLEAKAMGHNMLTLNPGWSVVVIGEFFGDDRRGDR